MEAALIKSVNHGRLNRNQIKYIAIIAMLADHTAWAVWAVSPFLWACMHFIGRLTGPTMAYFESGSLFLHLDNGLVLLNPAQSVIFTLFLGLSSIRIWESPKMKKLVKIICIILLCLLSCIGDWAFMDVLGCLFVHIYRNRPRAKWIAFTLTFFIPNALLMILADFHSVWYQAGVLLVPLMLGFLYNGQCGSKAKIHKWFFYLFYPAHLAVLGLLKWGILR